MDLNEEIRRFLGYFATGVRQVQVKADLSVTGQFSAGISRVSSLESSGPIGAAGDISSDGDIVATGDMSAANLSGTNTGDQALEDMVTPGTSGNVMTSNGTTWVSQAPSGGGAEKLTGNITVYVRTDGSNSNDGSANDSGHAFLTIPYAITYVTKKYDFNGYTITIKCADGTYTDGIVGKSIVGEGMIIIQGNTSTWANCIISTTSADCALFENVRGSYRIEGFKLQTTTSGNAIKGTGNCTYVEFQSIDFGACASSHINFTWHAIINCIGDYTVSGNATYHWGASSAGLISVVGRNVTISTTITVTDWAFCSSNANVVCYSTTYTNKTNVTGQKYNVTSCGVINGTGHSDGYLPGTTDGSRSYGGQYIGTVICTGGTVTVVGGYRIHTFTTSGTLTVEGSANFEVLVVGGGGGGGGNGGGGGGGGGIAYSASLAFSTANYVVTVGNGGAGKGNAANGDTGQNSSISSLTGLGGGGGGYVNTSDQGHSGSNGGCGGGGSGGNDGNKGGGTGSPGKNGGQGDNGSYKGGGGGGMGVAGVNSSSTGNGGDGSAYSISGSSVYYSGGGGGGRVGGAGGQGGGGAGGTGYSNGSNGTANLGGGGGGGAWGSGTGGTGGSGVVIVKYAE